MATERVKTHYQQQLLFEGFLGGFVLTSLILVLTLEAGSSVYGSRDGVFFNALVLLMAITSFWFVLLSWGSVFVGSDMISLTGPKGRRLRRVMFWMNRIGMLLVLGILGLIAFPFSNLTGLVVFGIGTWMLATFDHIRIEAIKERVEELEKENEKKQATQSQS
jgi:hypothetical protein